MKNHGAQAPPLLAKYHNYQWPPPRPTPGYGALYMPPALCGLDIPPSPELNAPERCLATARPLLNPAGCSHTACPMHWQGRAEALLS